MLIVSLIVMREKSHKARLLLMGGGLEFPYTEFVNPGRLADGEKFQAARVAGRQDQIGEHDFAVVCEYLDRRGVQEDVQRYAAVAVWTICFVDAGKLGMKVGFPGMS